MTDKELIKAFLGLVITKHHWDCEQIATELNMTVDMENKIDKYKGKLWSWTSHTGYDPEGAYSIWFNSLNHMIDNEMRDRMKKCLIRIL